MSRTRRFNPLVESLAAASAAVLLSLVAVRADAIDATVYFQVNTTADLVDDNLTDRLCHTSANNCSLRAAIMQSNHIDTNGLTRIDLGPGVYALTLPLTMDGNDGEDRGDLNLTAPIDSSQRTIIVGAAAASTVIDGNHSDGVLGIAKNRKVTMSDITLRNGYGFFGGGAIDNRGILDISFCVIEHSEARLYGGAIHNDFATLHVANCTLRSNTADSGGAIFVTGTAKIEASTLSGNSANNGGGIYNDGDLVVVNGTVSGNTANADGGGIYSRIHAYLYSTSVIDNIADLDHDESGGAGGGVYSEASGGTFQMTNSLVVRNTINGGYVDADCHGAFALYGFNLFNDVVGCTFAGNGSAAWRFILSPNDVGPLQDNGGPLRWRTFTHALRAGSNAIDATYDQGCIDETGNALPGDQRDAVRVAGQRCDVGAFEFGAVVDVIFYDGFE
jgi:CSLREA domain-containing protein